jgi:GNAT superfamily N-acetyltransferase
MTATIRLAQPAELDVILGMHRRSMRVLGAGYYATEVIEAALARMGTLDPGLIEDGTYLVAEADGALAGSAGWSLRPSNYAKLMREALAPLPGRVGLVRSVFVEPRMARRGIARALMKAAEARLAQAGVDTAELMATLSGVPFYASLGYERLSDHALEVGDGLAFGARRMARMLPALSRAA